MPENLNPEQQLEYLKELRAKYEEVLTNAQKTGDYSEAKRLKEELEQRLTELEALFPKPEAKAKSLENDLESEEFDELAFQEKALQEFDKYFVSEEVGHAIIAENLSYFGSRKAMVLRKVAEQFGAIVKFGAIVNRSLLIGLAGVDNENAWQLRDSFEITTNAQSLLQSLAGIDSERAWEMREDIESFVSYNDISSELIQSLTGLDSNQAWIMREKLQNLYKGDIDIKNQLLQSLAGIDSEHAWDKREELYDNNNQLPYVVTSVTGLDYGQAWGYRKDFKLQLDAGLYDKVPEINESILAKSLAGIDSDLAWSYRERWKELEQFYFLAPSLAGIDTQRAWDMRGLISEEYSESRLSGEVAILSLNGDLTTAIGWRTARKYQKEKE